MYIYVCVVCVYMRTCMLIWCAHKKIFNNFYSGFTRVFPSSKSKDKSVLESTGIHPESYKTVDILFDVTGMKFADVGTGEVMTKVRIFFSRLFNGYCCSILVFFHHLFLSLVVCIQVENTWHPRSQRRLPARVACSQVRDRRAELAHDSARACNAAASRPARPVQGGSNKKQKKKRKSKRKFELNELLSAG